MSYLNLSNALWEWCVLFLFFLKSYFILPKSVICCQISQCCLIRRHFGHYRVFGHAEFLHKGSKIDIAKRIITHSIYTAAFMH